MDDDIFLDWIFKLNFTYIIVISSFQNFDEKEDYFSFEIIESSMITKCISRKIVNETVDYVWS